MEIAMGTLQADCILDAKALVGEGVVWCEASQKALWVDVWNCTLHRFDIESGLDEQWILPEKVGCVAPLDGDRVMVGLTTGLYEFNLHTGDLSLYFAIRGGGTQNRCNDSVVDPAGRLWCGTMNLQGLLGDPTGELYSMRSEAEATSWLQELHLPNGLACSPDGKTLYLSDSHPRSRLVWQFDLDAASGHIGNQRVFFDCSEMVGRPDGATVDIDGCYWICAVDGGEVLRITPQGKVDRRVRLPVSKPSKVAIGGKNHDTLLITTISAQVGKQLQQDSPLSGGLFAVHVGAIGVPSPMMKTTC
ncbi:SMP-30/gluconolactonase/LRE family protein [Noviherbaspirillum aerium]|uniref:SMP-30/gluconolactonase/LRE family protein n=1 Tax=Noviherbaspirillum aerium TaxID=2588497 RepID=UPI00124F5674|nr:SMP-30/gluconolactonase/LRE family protein [Noviherbaspirillum aerium]